MPKTNTLNDENPVGQKMTTKHHGNIFWILCSIFFILLIFGLSYISLDYYKQNLQLKSEYNKLVAEFDLANKQIEVLSNRQCNPSNLINVNSVDFKSIDTGTIEGSLIYPSEVLPDQEVCAENLVTGCTYCTTKNILDERFRSAGAPGFDKGYQLTIPVGNYLIYVVWGQSLKIYYDEFVTCGLKYGCPSHKPITVKVEKGITLTKIDPQDWYNN